MRKTNFSLAGFAAILSAAVLVPLFIFQLYADITGAKLLSRVVNFASVILYVYVFLSLKDLLHNHEQHEADGLVDLSIGINIVGTLLTQFIPQASGFGAFLGVMFFIGMGILYILIGIKILNVRSELHGLAKAIGIVTIITGACMASILLMPVAMVSAIAMDVMLGIAFFKEGSNPRTRHRIDPHFGTTKTTNTGAAEASGEEDWSTIGRIHRTQSSTTIFVSILAVLVIGGLAVWFARVSYAKREIANLQQEAAIQLQQIQAQALAQQARMQAEQRRRIETERRWKREHPTIVGYQKIWIPGKPLSECKKPGQAMDNATIACLNERHENIPIYSQQ